jgi:hypothetical protein
LCASLGPVGALRTAPGLARAFTLLVLGGWGLESVGDLANRCTVVVNELCTNVVQAATDSVGAPVYQEDGRLSAFRLQLTSDRARLRVEVLDNLPLAAGVPVLRPPGEFEEHGRGLALVAGLSLAWGWSPVPDRQAKSVWAVLNAR